MTRSPISLSRLAILSLLGLGLLVGLGLAPAAQAAPERTSEQRLLDWFHDMDAFYAANPDLKHSPGSGWKPYNRAKWFTQQRMVDGQLPPVGARWRAWEVKRQREATLAPRATWFSLGPANFSGRILALEFDPTDAATCYAGGADGGVWKTTDSGASWTPISDELPSIAVGGIAVSPLDPNIVVIGTGEGTNNIDRVGGVGVLRSTDAGATWQTTSLSYAALGYGGGHGFHFVEANPITGTIMAGAVDGIWRSSDNGDTWTNVRPNDLNDYYDLVWKPGDSNVCYAVKGDAGSGNGIKKSTNDGLTFANAGTGQPPSFEIGKSKLAMTAAQPTWVYAVYVYPAGGATRGVYRSTDEGGTWTAQNTTTNFTNEQGWYNLTLAVDPNNASTVICGGVPLFRSVNAGVTWGQVGSTPPAVHVDHHAIAYEPGSNTNVWVGNDGGVWRSTDDGATWPAGGNLNNGLITYQFYDICVNNNGSTAYYVMGGTQDNGTDKWSGTTTWANGLGSDGMVCNINPSNGTTVFAEVYGGAPSGTHYKSTNSGGNPWININVGLTGGEPWVVAVAERASPGNYLFTSTNDGVFRTTDGGSTWTLVDGVSATWLDVSEVNGDYVWALSGQLRYSTDNGDTWQAAAAYGFPTGGVTKVLAHPTDLNTVFVVFSGYGAGFAHVARSTDLGATWADVTGDFPSQPVNAIEVNPSNTAQWFIGTDVGVWATEDGGVHWVPFETGFPNAVVLDLEIQNALQKLVAGTHGRGAWEIDIPASLGTGVAVAVEPALRDLMLDAPFPNPVSDRTMFRYAAKSQAGVSLAVYDVQGRLVSDLADFSRGDGIIRTTPWFTDDVPSGVYFAVLRAGDASISRKVVVAK
jgi:hypothetical protein